jgi:hypothetical protein
LLNSNNFLIVSKTIIRESKNMKLSTIIRRIPSSIQLPNLGGKSSFEVINNGNKLTIRNSSGTTLLLNQKLLDAVWCRYQSLPKPKRYQAGQYVPSNWKECPNKIFSPLIARIIAFLS